MQAGLAGLAAAGHTYELRGMIWHQGENDTTSTAIASAYQANLTSLVQRVRQDLNGGQAMPFVIGSLSNSQDSSITTPGTAWYLVRQAQQTVSQTVSQTGFVNTDGYPTRPGEAIHFNHQGQISLGQGFASEILRLEAADADNDGLTLDQETSLGTNPFNPDSDGDSQNDGLEVNAGTNPLSGSSSFKVTNFTVSGNQVSLQWPSKPGNTYRIERSTNLVDWTTAAANVPAAAAASLTIWNGLLQESSSVVLARYDAQTGLNGNFNTTAFDSVDSDPLTTATRLIQGGSLTGGGSNLYILANALFATSGSGSPGFNFAGVATASQSAAATAGDFFSFTVQSGAASMTYESLSFFADQFGTTGKIDISRTIGGTETFIQQGFTPPGSNANVALQNIDFTDFTTAENVTWTFYLYGATGTSPAASLHGTRFDDITLNGLPAVAPPSRLFYRVILVGTGA